MVINIDNNVNNQQSLNNESLIFNNKDLEEKFNEIKNLFKIVDNIENDKKRNLLKHKFRSEIDFSIDNIEDYYYRYVLKNKKEDKIIDETEKLIYNSKKVMSKFLPYILLYSINSNDNNNDDN
jgi:hypothetical protein